MKSTVDAGNDVAIFVREVGAAHSLPQRLCSRLTALWSYINFVLLLLLLLLTHDASSSSSTSNSEE